MQAAPAQRATHAQTAPCAGAATMQATVFTRQEKRRSRACSLRPVWSCRRPCLHHAPYRPSVLRYYVWRDAAVAFNHRIRERQLRAIRRAAEPRNQARAPARRYPASGCRVPSPGSPPASAGRGRCLPNPCPGISEDACVPAACVQLCAYVIRRCMHPKRCHFLTARSLCPETRPYPRFRRTRTLSLLCGAF